MIRFGLQCGLLAVVAAASAFGSVGCSGGGEVGDSPAFSSLARVVPESAGSHCESGGQAIESGLDANGNGQLDADEVKETSYVCNGVSKQVLPTITQIPAGDPRCQFGGTSIAIIGANGQPEKETVVCNGATGDKGDQGVQGIQGIQGEQGDAGPQGIQGDAGAPAPEPVLGIFAPSQVVKGAVVTCGTINTTATTVECRTMKVNGMDVYLGPTEAGVICSGVTGKGYNSASGMGVVASPWLKWSNNAWTIGTGNASPMQNVTCNR